MKTQISSAIALLLVALAACAADQTIGLSPAGVSLRGSAGQTATYTFRVSNQTDTTYLFRVEVADVVVENGTRKFVRAGQTPGSIAALATASREAVTVGARQDAAVPVTFGVPEGTALRAVAVFFTGEDANPDLGARVRTRMGLGAVVDFTLSDTVALDARPPEVAPPSATANTAVTQHIRNAGPEPFIVRGVAAFIGPDGKLAGKATFEQKRFLPGEANQISAEYPGTLPAGKYRVLCSLEYAGKAATHTVEFNLP